MAEITINGVKFTNIPNKRTGVKIGNKLSQSNFTGNLEEYLASEDFHKLLCAIDIDWNGIEVAENVVINDTAELINWIKSIEGQAGATGPQGPKGDTGEAGPKGDTGEAGPKGDTGEAGPKGDTGAQGPKGDTGTFDASALEDYATKTYVGEKIEEIVGEAPETFDTLKEIADWIGEHGEVVGLKGDKGDTGEAGPKGDTGEAGPKGDTGEAGQQGPKGDTGEDGQPGPKGDTGEDGQPGPKGDTGEDGQPGPKGDTGATGPQGPKGDTGATGPQGPQGDTGTFDSSALANYALKQDVIDNEEVVATALADLNTKYEALLARVVALEGATDTTGEGGGE